MNNEQIVQLQGSHNAWPMYRAMVGLGLVCAIILVAVFRLTTPAIQHNKQLLLQHSIYQLFPQAHAFVPFSVDESGKVQRLTGNQEAAQFYAVYDGQNTLTGIAIRVETPGYQDTLQLLYAYQPITQRINGYQILESRETPGLGSRIETDQTFRANFRQLPVPLNNTNTALLHPLTVVKHGRKTQPWQIDTISGATISSRALATAVARSAARWLPKLKQQQELLNRARSQ